MKWWERWTFAALTAIVSASGGAYFWMKYVLTTDDPFAVTNHPLQAAMLSLHVVASPGLILMFGVILNSHIMRKLGARRVPNRKTGLVSLGSFFAMAASGYLLQVVTSESLLQAMLVLHLASGAVFTLTYGLHLAISYRLGRAQAPSRLTVEPA
jgi:hypothetical protein